MCLHCSRAMVTHPPRNIGGARVQRTSKATGQRTRGRGGEKKEAEDGKSKGQRLRRSQLLRTTEGKPAQRPPRSLIAWGAALRQRRRPPDSARRRRCATTAAAATTASDRANHARTRTHAHTHTHTHTHTHRHGDRYSQSKGWHRMSASSSAPLRRSPAARCSPIAAAGSRSHAASYSSTVSRRLSTTCAAAAAARQESAPPPGPGQPFPTRGSGRTGGMARRK